MKITVDDKVYDFDLTRITNVEGMAIEKVTDKTYLEWSEALQAGSMLAATALVWIIQKRQEPTLRFEDVEFSQLAIQDDDNVSPLEQPGPTGAADEAALAQTG